MDRLRPIEVPFADNLGTFCGPFGDRLGVFFRGIRMVFFERFLFISQSFHGFGIFGRFDRSPRGFEPNPFS